MNFAFNLFGEPDCLVLVIEGTFRLNKQINDTGIVLDRTPVTKLTKRSSVLVTMVILGANYHVHQETVKPS